ncbi:MAG: hypothetical protein AB8F74_09700 [Saprospiraceae bacterium]
MTKIPILIFLLLSPLFLFAQCLEEETGIIWKGSSNILSFDQLAEYAAPMLWFSPDEINLKDKDGNKQLPNAFPFQEQGDQPVVYYKLRNVYSINKELAVIQPESEKPEFRILDLSQVKAIDLDFYYYFKNETGPTAHEHDIESITIQLQVSEATFCPEYSFAILAKKVTARAHGNQWYYNAFDVDVQTFFPLSILIEEGKHASCTDKNADGTYTPTFDVTERINDAWGVRDIITSGRLVTGGFQAWMAKDRNKHSIVFPPLPKDSPNNEKFQRKFGSFIEGSQYELRPYPDYRKLKEEEQIVKGLDRFMKTKKPHDWPSLKKVSGSGGASVKQWIKDEKSYTSISLAYRWDDAHRISFAFPLFLFKNVEAPKTGGWIYNKVYFGDVSSVIDQNRLEKLLGHQITYSSSASKWVDTYIGLGYEVFDRDTDPKKTNYKFSFVSEAGIKIRLNVSNTPLRFLRHLGTDFWGIRMGWKNVGFGSFSNSGFVIEIGAGVF